MKPLIHVFLGALLLLALGELRQIRRDQHMLVELALDSAVPDDVFEPAPLGVSTRIAYVPLARNKLNC